MPPAPHAQGGGKSYEPYLVRLAARDAFLQAKSDHKPSTGLSSSIKSIEAFFRKFRTNPGTSLVAQASKLNFSKYTQEVINCVLRFSGKNYAALMNILSKIVLNNEEIVANLEEELMKRIKAFRPIRIIAHALGLPVARMSAAASPVVDAAWYTKKVSQDKFDKIQRELSGAVQDVQRAFRILLEMYLWGISPTVERVVESFGTFVFSLVSCVNLCQGARVTSVTSEEALMDIVRFKSECADLFAPEALRVALPLRSLAVAIDDAPSELMERVRREEAMLFSHNAAARFTDAVPAALLHPLSGIIDVLKYAARYMAVDLLGRPLPGCGEAPPELRERARAIKTPLFPKTLEDAFHFAAHMRESRESETNIFGYFIRVVSNALFLMNALVSTRQQFSAQKVERAMKRRGDAPVSFRCLELLLAVESEAIGHALAAFGAVLDEEYVPPCDVMKVETDEDIIQSMGPAPSAFDAKKSLFPNEHSEKFYRQLDPPGLATSVTSVAALPAFREDDVDMLNGAPIQKKTKKKQSAAKPKKLVEELPMLTSTSSADDWTRRFVDELSGTLLLDYISKLYRWSDKRHAASIPYVARTIATLHLIGLTQVEHIAKRQFMRMIGQAKNPNVKASSRIFTARFFAELLKFGLIPPREACAVLERLSTALVDRAGNPRNPNIEAFCSLLETGGGYLSRLPNASKKVSLALEHAKTVLKAVHLEPHIEFSFQNAVHACENFSESLLLVRAREFYDSTPPPLLFLREQLAQLAFRPDAPSENWAVWHFLGANKPFLQDPTALRGELEAAAAEAASAVEEGGEESDEEGAPANAQVEAAPSSEAAASLDKRVFPTPVPCEKFVRPAARQNAAIASCVQLFASLRWDRAMQPEEFVPTYLPAETQRELCKRYRPLDPNELVVEVVSAASNGSTIPALATLLHTLQSKHFTLHAPLLFSSPPPKKIGGPRAKFMTACNGNLAAQRIIDALFENHYSDLVQPEATHGDVFHSASAQKRRGVAALLAHLYALGSLHITEFFPALRACLVTGTKAITAVAPGPGDRGRSFAVRVASEFDADAALIRQVLFLLMLEPFEEARGGVPPEFAASLRSLLVLLRLQVDSKSTSSEELLGLLHARRAGLGALWPRMDSDDELISAVRAERSRMFRDLLADVEAVAALQARAAEPDVGDASSSAADGSEEDDDFDLADFDEGMTALTSPLRKDTPTGTFKPRVPGEYYGRLDAPRRQRRGVAYRLLTRAGQGTAISATSVLVPRETFQSTGAQRDQGDAKIRHWYIESQKLEKEDST
eukprot:gnl/Chilomastix_cuspidata/3522.p1 GENE.gnl/Chilomastix_cuspidata/3522~~gnl/Chilomastix_cuspidata/3522.p1  ORF type:complete len:1291 (+),score=530.70 gnl/Chilomastix_cuspidata/3522:40-3912(+)